MRMREIRSFEERLTDRAVLLSLWHQAVEKPREDAGDKLWQMKTAWLATHDLFAARRKGLNLPFYRWKWGPMSNAVYEDWTAFEVAGLVKSEERFVFTRAGDALATAVIRDLFAQEENTRFRDAISKAADKARKHKSTAGLLNAVYAMEVKPLGSLTASSVRSLPLGSQLTAILEVSEASETLFVEPAWLETLAVTFSPEARAAIARGERDFREGRVA